MNKYDECIIKWLLKNKGNDGYIENPSEIFKSLKHIKKAYILKKLIFMNSKTGGISMFNNKYNIYILRVNEYMQKPYNEYSKDIKNSEVPKYFYSIFKKTLNKVGELNNISEEHNWAWIMYKKFVTQFYSAIKLTYEGTYDGNLKKDVIDIFSVHGIIRSCFETYLLFNYIYVKNGSFEELKLKQMIYRYNGYKEMLEFGKRDSEEYNNIEKLAGKLKVEIKNNNIYRSYYKQNKEKAFSFNWKPKYTKMAKEFMPSNWSGVEAYNILSKYVHCSFKALNDFNHFLGNGFEYYNLDVVNCQLYQFATLFTENIITLFKLKLEEIFTNEEIGLLLEFNGLAIWEREI